ncbi:post-segregation antitoxin CcdA [Devosia sp. Root413D1]|uniref:type II toxin-antitoxin system CcdA family antitoxin n=1 Tax=unclassified Devosia TaxID=196773 RepID=UPI0006F5B60E|nr:MULTISPECIES: type II toxin-antitoxin system CcdA family antitoxin [unclassified Devosia]KQU99669.1 post-segregation antitoxin CcdA [Devosia sp. Root105]KQW80315.1 post-segregation antitoxin CcdA [Devosia sp. Root413D1]
MTATRRSTKVTLDSDLIEEARSMNINLSRAAEAGIARAIVAEKTARQWAEENADVIRSNNEYVARHGLPLRKYRSF